MKKYLLFLIMVFVLTSCIFEDEFAYIGKAEIINANTIHIFFSGNISEIDTRHDIRILVNDAQEYHIKSHSYNVFQDDINGFKRFRCTLNKNLLVGDKVEIIGLGRSVFGSVTVYFN